MSENILVIDDDLESLEITKRKLLTNYYNVYPSSDSTRALEILSENLIDVILLDIMMPKVNGFDLCRSIRNNPFMQYIPIIILTAYNDINNKNTSFQLGADYFLSKPIDIRSFSFKVKPLIRIKKTISIGVAKYDQNMPYHDLIYKADLAMYKAKKSGKTRCAMIFNLFLSLSVTHLMYNLRKGV